MNELIDINPDINVLENEYKRLLGYPKDIELKERSLELSKWAREWYNKNSKPWIYALQTNEIDFSNEKLRVNNIEFSSRKLCNQLAESQADSAMLVAVSAGEECEVKANQLWQEGKPDEYFFLEVYGSAVVEHLITIAGARFCAWADENNLAVLPHCSPGYPGWNVTDQNKLFQLIGQKRNHDLPGIIEVLETGMLKPKKSMLALFGITKNIEKVRRLTELIPCETCSLQGCRYRRTSYKYSRNQIEDVSKLQPGKNRLINVRSWIGNNFTGILNKNAKYNISIKALEKWSNERLNLKILEDNSIEANFKYEGTTCSNIGHPLEFNYFVKLSSPEDSFKIISMVCNPAQNDVGYKYMCEYINDSESLMNCIMNEKPLLDKPLNDILNWKYLFSPEGCFCKSESRDHKWGLVLEVLHYAMVNYENQEVDPKISNVVSTEGRDLLFSEISHPKTSSK